MLSVDLLSVVTLSVVMLLSTMLWVDKNVSRSNVFWPKDVEPLRLPFELIWRQNGLNDQNCKKITFSKIRVTRRLGKKLAQRLEKVAKIVAKQKTSIYVHQSPQELHQTTFETLKYLQ
jgi:hypothetical protein